jgi:CheY-like chemotaxis protein
VSSPHDLPPPRILVVEGYQPFRQTLRRMLESRYDRVLVATDAAWALDVWRWRAADLLILDLQMPRCDGLEVLLEFHALAPDRPIIAISVQDRARGFDLLRDALRLGAIKALAKPFRLVELLDLIAEVLETGVPQRDG